MIIEHQIVTDADGKPVAAQIPWEQFRVIQAEWETDDDEPLSPEWKAELNRRLESIKDGTAKLLTHEEVMERVQNSLKDCRVEREKSA